jgi:hypothetical protein
VRGEALPPIRRIKAVSDLQLFDAVDGLEKEQANQGAAVFKLPICFKRAIWK